MDKSKIKVPGEVPEETPGEAAERLLGVGSMTADSDDEIPVPKISTEPVTEEDEETTGAIAAIEAGLDARGIIQSLFTVIRDETRALRSDVHAALIDQGTSIVNAATERAAARLRGDVEEVVQRVDKHTAQLDTESETVTQLHERGSRLENLVAALTSRVDGLEEALNSHEDEVVGKGTEVLNRIVAGSLEPLEERVDRHSSALKKLGERDKKMIVHQAENMTMLGILNDMVESLSPKLGRRADETLLAWMVRTDIKLSADYPKILRMMADGQHSEALRLMTTGG